MKILHVATGFPITFPGGVTNYVRSLARSQKQLGCNVDILCTPLELGAKYDSFADNIIPYEGVASVFSLSLNRDDSDKASVLHAILRKYDVVHFHMSYGFPASFYDQKVSVPYVVSLHDYGYICPRIFMVDKWGRTCDWREITACESCVGVLEQINTVRAAANRFNFNLPTIRSTSVVQRKDRFDHFLRQSNLRLAVSTRVARIFEDAVPGSQCEVIHIGNDSAKQIPQKNKWLTKQGKVRCCFLGTLNRAKGAEIFETLAKRLSGENFEFVFWGRGEDEYLERLKAVNVKIGGAYTTDNLPQILSEVDVGMVLPVWHDNGPQVLMEFINNGIPVLGADMGGVPDFLTPDTGFLFDPNNETGIDLALAWLRSLNAAGLTRMNEQMKPLKSPEEHAREIYTRYLEITAK